MLNVQRGLIRCSPVSSTLCYIFITSISIIVFYRLWDAAEYRQYTAHFNWRLVTLGRVCSDNQIFSQLRIKQFPNVLMWLLLTFRLSSWSRLAVVALKCFQLVAKYPAFYGYGRFTAVFTTTCHMAWTTWVQSTRSRPLLFKVSLLSSHLLQDLQSLSLNVTSGSLFLFSSMCTRRPVHHPRFNHSDHASHGVNIKLLIMQSCLAY